MPMKPSDWARSGALALAIYLDGSDAPDRAQDGTPLLDDDFLVLVNAWWQPLSFTVPSTRVRLTWQIEIDTDDPSRPASGGSTRAGDQVAVGPRSIVVLVGPLLADAGPR
jgi:glycogen operon protein